MASYQTPIISLGVQPPPTLMSRTTSRLSDSVEESKPVSGDGEAIRKFSDKYIVPGKLVAPCPDKNVQGEEERGD